MSKQSFLIFTLVERECVIKANRCILIGEHISFSQCSEFNVSILDALRFFIPFTKVNSFVLHGCVHKTNVVNHFCTSSSKGSLSWKMLCHGKLITLMHCCIIKLANTTLTLEVDSRYLCQEECKVNVLHLHPIRVLRSIHCR